MARILAIDYGRKRVGVAVTDSLQIIATGLTTIHSKDIIQFIKEYLEKEEVELFVIGEAFQLDYTPSESSVYTEPFVRLLSKTFPQIPIVRIDERFTSKIASRTMMESGISKKARQNKALIDTISATIILQSYLSQRSISNF